jgi:hypothetical protein
MTVSHNKQRTNKQHDNTQYEESKTDESAMKPAAKDGNAPRFEIKKWNAVAMWSWDICADTVRQWLLTMGRVVLCVLLCFDGSVFF